MERDEEAAFPVAFSSFFLKCNDVTCASAQSLPWILALNILKIVCVLLTSQLFFGQDRFLEIHHACTQAMTV